MAKTIFSGVWRIGRVTALALGVAVMLALIAGAASAAFGANGKPFLLGKKNVASAVSTLAKQGPGPALSLVVKANQPPLKVNSTGKVPRLNADMVDGKHASAFLPKGGKAADADKLDGQDSSTFLAADAKAADSDLLDGRDYSQFVPTATNSFVRNLIYQSETPQSTGTLLGDYTRRISVSCAPGDVLLSGGPANIDVGTNVLESFPKDGTWIVRIQNDAGPLDSFSVVVRCADQ